MLDPKQNRIYYGDQLIPPDDYELDLAIGTTYSLDLEALMVLPVALFYAQKIDGDGEELRFDMLEAITKAAEKIKIFYQNGQLKVPKKYYRLMAYWEAGIHAVTMSDHLRSFHPKVWVIRYVHKNLNPKYRVLVTSRNLTFARDWDIAFATEGEVTTKEQPGNKPLIDFLAYLNATEEKHIPQEFLSDLLKVKFDNPESFNSLKFIPIGIPNSNTRNTYLNPLTTSRSIWDEMLIVSPFLDKTTLTNIQVKTEKTISLLSRKEEMDCIDTETLENFRCFQFNPYIETAEFNADNEDDGPEPMSESLHAKLFIGMKDRVPHWFLGSANCSSPAQDRNVEFMVGLMGSNTKGLKAKDILKALTTPEKFNDITLFTDYDFDARENGQERKNIDLAIRKIKYDLTKLPLTGEASVIEGGTAYKLSIHLDARGLSLPVGFDVSIKPLPEKQKNSETILAGHKNDIETFGGYAETDLSVFLIFEIAKDEITNQFLLPMDIELPGGRLNKIFTSIIDSQEKFLKYLTFLLTEEETSIIANCDEEVRAGSGNGRNTTFLADTPVYEKLLIVASRFPDKLSSVDKLINRIKAEGNGSEEPIISEAFLEFWEIFQSFIKNKAK